MWERLLQLYFGLFLPFNPQRGFICCGRVWGGKAYTYQSAIDKFNFRTLSLTFNVATPATSRSDCGVYASKNGLGRVFVIGGITAGAAIQVMVMFSAKTGGTATTFYSYGVGFYQSGAGANSVYGMHNGGVVVGVGQSNFIFRFSFTRTTNLVNVAIMTVARSGHDMSGADSEWLHTLGNNSGGLTDDRERTAFRTMAVKFNTSALSYSSQSGCVGSNEYWTMHWGGQDATTGYFSNMERCMNRRMDACVSFDTLNSNHADQGSMCTQDQMVSDSGLTANVSYSTNWTVAQFRTKLTRVTFTQLSVPWEERGGDSC